jgi:hypothetical protein
MPPKKSKLSGIEVPFDAPIDGASFYRATVTHDKARAWSNTVSPFMTKLKKTKEVR